MANKISLCGVRIDNVTLDEAVKNAFSKERSPCAVFTPNAVMLDACRRNPTLAVLLNRATLSLPDGAGVLLAAKRKGTPLRARAAGIDFGETLMKRAARDGLKLFLLGGKEGVAEQAAKNLSLKYPHLTICGTHHGYFQKEGSENAAVLSQIAACKPDILFVCFGFPAQERWILKSLPSLPCLRVAAGLGGSLDVWSGNTKRAPKSLQRCGLEWAWRMIREPKRFKNLPSMLDFFLFS